MRALLIVLLSGCLFLQLPESTGPELNVNAYLYEDGIHYTVIRIEPPVIPMADLRVSCGNVAYAAEAHPDNLTFGYQWKCAEHREFEIVHLASNSQLYYNNGTAVNSS